MTERESKKWSVTQATGHQFYFFAGH